MQEATTILPIPGLLYFPNVLPVAEKTLLGLIDSQPWMQVMGPKSRLVQQYGFRYCYKTMQLFQDVPPIPAFLQPLMTCARALLTAHITADPSELEFDSAIINRYLPGEGIAAHFDSNKFGDVVVCFSLGTKPCPIRFSGREVHDILIAPKSMYVMMGDARHRWRHSICAQTSDMIDGKEVMREPRFSITFRKVRDVSSVTKSGSPLLSTTAPCYEKVQIGPKQPRQRSLDAFILREHHTKKRSKYEDATTSSEHALEPG